MTVHSIMCDAQDKWTMEQEGEEEEEEEEEGATMGAMGATMRRCPVPI